MKHRHHIIPRHMGGSEDPSNIVYLTVAEHAEAHRLLYEQHGKWEDRIAWLGLSGAITTEEVIEMVLHEAGLKGKYTLERWHGHIRGKSYEEIYGPDKAHELREARRKRFSGRGNPNFGKQHSAERRASHSKALSGRVWMHKDGVRKTFNPTDVEAAKGSGWVKGRIVNTRPKIKRAQN